MKLDELQALGIEKEQADKIFAMAGRDIEQHKQTIAALTAERDGLKMQLSEANEKLAGYDPEWKNKAAQAAEEAEKKIAELTYNHAAERSVDGVKFSSESAKRAFLSDLKSKSFPMQDGKILGFDDFLKEYRNSDPGAFEPEKPTPQFGGPTPGPIPGGTDRDKANAALRAAIRKEG